MPKPQISADEVKHIAKLAKLKLDSSEIIKFQKQLSDIIGFVDVLKKVDTNNVKASANISGLKNVFREDVITVSLTQEKTLSNASDKYKGYFKVKAIL